jgi:hypothetical protein
MRPRYQATLRRFLDRVTAAMVFPETGQYVVPDALDLVAIDREQDRGTYAETNLWMRHAQHCRARCVEPAS